MKILIVSPVSAHAVKQLERRHEVIPAFNASNDQIMSKIVGCDVLIFRSGPNISADVMECSRNLSLLIRAGSGLDNLDLEYVNRRGLTLRRIQRPGARAVAELAFALMLSLARQLPRADSLLREGRWIKHELTGYLLRGKTLGVYGAGNIGTTVGEMGAAWGMKVLGCVKNATADRMLQLAEHGIEVTDDRELLGRADFVSLHVPLDESTRNLIDKEAIELMKPTAYLINLSRGGVVNEQSLAEALRNGRLAGAGIDVHEREGEGQISPLAELPSVILTPHIGAGTVDTQREIGDQILSIVAEHEAVTR